METDSEFLTILLKKCLIKLMKLSIGICKRVLPIIKLGIVMTINFGDSLKHGRVS